MHSCVGILWDVLFLTIKARTIIIIALTILDILHLRVVVLLVLLVVV